MIVPADAEIPPHQVAGNIMLHCLEGHIVLGVAQLNSELSAREWLYLNSCEDHSLKGAHVRLLVVGRADERRLSRPTDAQALVVARRRQALRSLADAGATTAHEVCPHEAVAHFIKPAQRVTESLELRVTGAQGVLLGRSERLIVD